MPNSIPTVEGTVYQALRRSAATYEHNDFLCIESQAAERYAIQARSYSYGQAATEVDFLKSVYAAAGLGHGHRAGLMLENRPMFFFHWLALNALGVSVVPINPEWRRAELEYLLDHSEACVAVVPPARAECQTERSADEAQPHDRCAG